ncbi:D-alanyl-D-alanine carboxypeptidase family protein [Cohnella algarum]|uniref:D-alanyl-D-alanine carboxypeptidase family protein n=1 Tax=Cohnella algarum TaxID=2044859 RepID=UPI001967DD89|nr:D-alanyl-D-alanine carboxypeptidase family protein [Cohnella algarum]MBN2981763.1 D-alanyl-D-alanine carboxypeptidase [Cohnella algarum]
MTQLFQLTLVSALMIMSLPQNTFADGSKLDAGDLSAESAILIDGASGTVLFEKNADRQMYPASITKIITAIVALETTDLNEIVTVSKEARYEDGTRVYLAEGEQLTMEKLLYGLMVNSGNDAATAIAEHIDGSKQQFAIRMNEFVKTKIGVANTISKNPSGLPDPEHVTTARDMAKIAQYAMQNSTFRKIVSTKEMDWNGEEWETTLINHNRLLGSYEGTTGIKNGFTHEAGSTLVASANRNGMELIGVVLKSPSSEVLYKDMTQLLDYGFQNFEPKTIFEANQSYTYSKEGLEIKFVAKEPIRTVVLIGEEPKYSVNSNGEVVLDTTMGQQTIGELEALPPPIEPEATSPETATPSIDDSRSIFEYLIFALWLLMILFMGFVGRLILLKKKRSKRELGRGYWN